MGGRRKKGSGRGGKGRRARAADLKNLMKAQGKQTGPKTETGKAIVSMNAVKSGEYLRKFHRLGLKAGKMERCQACGEAQIAVCTEIASCELQDFFISQYFKAYSDRDLSHIEEINMLQTAQMDLLFDTKLQYAIAHIDDKVKDKETGRDVYLIGWEYLYGLVNMYTTLRKNMDDMKMTRKTIDNDMGILKELMNLQLDPEKEDETRREVLGQIEKLVQMTDRVSTMRKSDKTIQEFEKTQHQDTEVSSGALKAVGGSPFRKAAEDAEFEDL